MPDRARKSVTGERSLTWRGWEEAGAILPTSGAPMGPHVCQARCHGLKRTKSASCPLSPAVTMEPETESEF